MTVRLSNLAWATDPSTSPEELARYARGWPDEVLAHPVVPFLALADPAAWASIVGPARESVAMRVIKWTVGELHRRGARDVVRTWRLDCLERVAGGCEQGLSARIKQIVWDVRRSAREMNIVAELRKEGWRENLRPDRDRAAYEALETSLMLTRDAWAGPYACARAIGVARAEQGGIEQMARATELEWAAKHLAYLEVKSRPASFMCEPAPSAADGYQAFRQALLAGRVRLPR